MIILFLGVSQAISILFLGYSIKKLYAYINVYRFDESIYHHLFGFIRIKHLVRLYVFSTFAILFTAVYTILIL